MLLVVFIELVFECSNDVQNVIEFRQLRLQRSIQLVELVFETSSTH